MIRVENTPLITAEGLFNILADNNLDETFNFFSLINAKRRFITDKVLTAWADSKFFTSMREIDLSDCSLITTKGFLRFLGVLEKKFENQFQIHKINIRNTNIDDEFLKEFLSFDFLRDATHINIRDCFYISPRGFEKFLTEYEALEDPRLAKVLLEYEPFILRLDLIKLLKPIESLFLLNLQELHLQYNLSVNSEFIEALADTPLLRNLHYINISYTSVDEDGCISIAKSKFLTNLINLRVKVNFNKSRIY